MKWTPGRVVGKMKERGTYENEILSIKGEV